MARRKKKTTRRRRRSNPIGAIRRRRSGGRSGGNLMSNVMDAAFIAGGLIVGQIVSKQLEDKVEALKDGKIRGAALAALGIVGGRMLPGGLAKLGTGIAAAGLYNVAKELMPQTIGELTDDGMGALSPAEVDLIENMALESEVTGLEEAMDEEITGMDTDVMSTVTGDLDTDVMSTVTGMDDDEDDN